MESQSFSTIAHLKLRVDGKTAINDSASNPMFSVINGKAYIKVGNHKAIIPYDCLLAVLTEGKEYFLSEDILPMFYRDSEAVGRRTAANKLASQDRARLRRDLAARFIDGLGLESKEAWKLAGTRYPER